MTEDTVNRSNLEDTMSQADSSWFLESGIKPAQQARSRATLIALLNAGRKTLEEGTLEELTVSDVASRANTSVGAFYGRFDNKEVFFYAIQEMVLSELSQQLNALFIRLKQEQVDSYQYIDACTSFWISIFRENRGLYQAAFKHSSSVPGVWTPFKRLGYQGSELLVNALLPLFAKQGIECDEKKIKVAMQFVNGLLVNATINDPGPVRLYDDELQSYVARFLYTFLGLELRTETAEKPN